MDGGGADRSQFGDTLHAMKLRQLRYYVKIVERGSFSRAAVDLHVAQPALSQQIAELEQLLGVSLLHRNARGVRATAAGEALYAEAVEILRRIERLPGIVRSARGELEGTVTLGMSSTLAAVLAGPFMEANKKVLPKVGLRFVTHDSESLRSRVADQKLDLAVVFEDEPVTGFARTPLFRQRLYLVQRRKTPRSPPSITLARLAERPLVLPAHPNIVRALLDRAFEAARVSPQTAAELDVFPSILSAVESGLGDTILPKGDFSDAPGNTKVFAIPIEPPLYLTASLISSNSGIPTRAVEAVQADFVGFARRHLETHPVPGAEWIGPPEA
jgi:LysR family transcriptional regulator, nitrogen assimilation regulatory protein